MRPPGSAEALESRRRCAVNMLAEGRTESEVRQALGCSSSSLSRWRHSSSRQLRARPTTGRPPKLYRHEQQLLLRLLRRGAVAHGWQTERWTGGRIAQLIEQHFGVKYHRRYVPELMRQLRWSPQLPQRRAVERDEEKIKRWKEEQWPALLAKAQKEHAHLAFLDESGIMLAASLRRTWAPVGHPPTIRMHASHGRVSMISAIVVSSQLRTVDLYFDHQLKNFRQPAVCAFLERLLAEKRGPIVTFMDQGRIHRGDPIRDLIRKHPRLSVEYFPSYAPELNPDEGVWKLLKEQLANGRAEDLWHLEMDAGSWLVLFSFLPRLLFGCIAAAGLLSHPLISPVTTQICLSRRHFVCLTPIRDEMSA